MELIGKIVIYIIMACAFAGCITSIVKEDSELGNEFLAGIGAIGEIFLPVAGIMASAPYLTKIVNIVFGNLFEMLGADSAMAATTFIAVDMGGYQLANILADSRESWIMAMITGYMAGATIVFSIPVALKMINKEDKPFLAMGMMAGFITIPIGVFISSCILMISKPMVRDSISTNGILNYKINIGLVEILYNLFPLLLICGLIVIGLILVPNKMIKGFTIFGKMLDSILRLVFVFSVMEYFTGCFSNVLGSWGFDPIIADEKDLNRALEVAGYIGIMLCGAFPMVYLLKKYLNRPISFIGEKLGISSDVTTGILACSANVLALLAMIKDMKPEDKIKTISFSVCGAFLIGDHLAFTANYQPTLIVTVLVGKLVAATIAVFIATKLIIPIAKKKNIF